MRFFLGDELVSALMGNRLPTRFEVFGVKRVGFHDLYMIYGFGLLAASACGSDAFCLLSRHRNRRFSIFIAIIWGETGETGRAPSLESLS